jgi:hypothetical protein
MLRWLSLFVSLVGTGVLAVAAALTSRLVRQRRKNQNIGGDTEISIKGVTFKGSLLPLVFVLGFALVLAGLYGASEDDKRRAAEIRIEVAAAIQSSVAVEADEYAPEQMRALRAAGEKTLAELAAESGRFVVFRSFGRLEQSASKIRSLNAQVISVAIKNREQTRLSVAQMLAETRAELDSATLALEAAPRRRGTRADVEMIRVDLAALRDACAEAEAASAAGQYRVAQSSIESANRRARELRQDIEAAIARSPSRGPRAPLVPPR